MRGAKLVRSGFIRYRLTTGTLLNASDPGANRYLINPDRTNFAPRIGRAVHASPMRGAKLVRSGFIRYRLAPGSLAFSSVPVVNRYLINPDRTNFAPRIGLAWTARPRLVVRSAYGIF